MTQKRLLSSERGRPGLLFIRDVFISEVFSHPSLSVLKEETPTTYSRKYMTAYAETTSELGH